ncbi:MAG: DUF167 domain-containing protein [Candidatus Latescibacterota bacterium]|nr:MAG: DUF167 domain-containing protein [Candidatus Latescibacterota bacterium]
MKTIDDLADGRIAFTVRVTPRASKSAVVGWTAAGQLKILICAPPVDDAANRELVKLLSKVLSIRKTNISLSSGSHSRTKRLVVSSKAKNRLLSYSDI